MAANVLQLAQQNHPQAVCAGLRGNPALRQALASGLSFEAAASFSASVLGHVNSACGVTGAAPAERKVLFDRLTAGVYLAAMRRSHLWDWHERHCTGAGAEQA